MTFSRATALGCLVAIGGFAACHSTVASSVDDAGSTAPPPPTFGGGPPAVDPFASDAAIGARVSALFGASCMGGPESGCHGAGAAGLTLRLGAGGDVVDAPSSERPDLVRVKPFDPANSYLFLKVRGDGGIDGGRMPLDAKDDPRIVTLVESWIEAGAPAP